MDRLFVEKKPEFNSAAGSLLNDLRTSLQLDGLESLRIVQRYDLEGLDPDQLEAASRLILFVIKDCVEAQQEIASYLFLL